MSFILDALKKLEQKKHHNSVPDLMTVHSSMPQEQKKHVIWPYILAAALLINAAILTAWLRPWEADRQEIALNAENNPEKEASAVEPGNTLTNTHVEESILSAEIEKETGTENKTVAAAQDVSPEKNIVSPVPSSQDDISESNLNEAEPTVETLTSRRLDMTPRELQDLKVQIQTDRLIPDEVPAPDTATREETESESSEGLLTFNQLPHSVRAALPSISINAHIYSNNPASRLANINGSIIRKGESLAPGLIVEEITMNGVIFNYEGLRFSKSAF